MDNKDKNKDIQSTNNQSLPSLADIAKQAYQDKDKVQSTYSPGTASNVSLEEASTLLGDNNRPGFGSAYFEPNLDNAIKTKAYQEAKLKAAEQGFLGEAAGAINQTVVGEIIGGTIDGAGFLFDWDQVDTLKNGETSFGSWLSEIGNDIRDWTKEVTPIYVDPDVQAKAFDMSSREWYMSNLPSVASALSIMIPVAGEAKTVSLIGQGLKATKGLAQLGKMGKSAKTVANILDKTVDAFRLTEKGLSNGAKLTIEGLHRAAVSTHIEAGMESVGAFKEEYQRLINAGKSEKEARSLAGETGAFVYRANWANFATEFFQQMLLLKNGPALTKGVIGGEEALAAGQAKKIGKLNLAKEYGKQFLSEGTEEAYQHIITQEGKYIADIKAGLAEEESFGNRMLKYAKDGELWTAAFFGGLGGAVFHKFGNKIVSGANKLVTGAEQGLTQQQIRINDLKTQHTRALQAAKKLGLAKESGDPEAILDAENDMSLVLGIQSANNQTLDYMLDRFKNLKNLSKEEREANNIDDNFVENIDRYSKNIIKAAEMHAENVNRYGQELAESITYREYHLEKLNEDLPRVRKEYDNAVTKLPRYTETTIEGRKLVDENIKLASLHQNKMTLEHFLKTGEMTSEERKTQEKNVEILNAAIELNTQSLSEKEKIFKDSLNDADRLVLSNLDSKFGQNVLSAKIKNDLYDIKIKNLTDELGFLTSKAGQEQIKKQREENIKKQQAKKEDKDVAEESEFANENTYTEDVEVEMNGPTFEKYIAEGKLTEEQIMSNPKAKKIWEDYKNGKDTSSGSNTNTEEDFNEGGSTSFEDIDLDNNVTKEDKTKGKETITFASNIEEVETPTNEEEVQKIDNPNSNMEGSIFTDADETILLTQASALAWKSFNNTQAEEKDFTEQNKAFANYVENPLINLKDTEIRFSIDYSNEVFTKNYKGNSIMGEMVNSIKNNKVPENIGLVPIKATFYKNGKPITSNGQVMETYIHKSDYSKFKSPELGEEIKRQKTIIVENLLKGLVVSTKLNEKTDGHLRTSKNKETKKFDKRPITEIFSDIKDIQFIIGSNDRKINPENKQIDDSIGTKTTNGAIYIKVKTALGNNFPLRTNVENISVAEANLVHGIYVDILKNPETYKQNISQRLIDFINNNKDSRIKDMNTYLDLNNLTNQELLDHLVFNGQSKTGHAKDSKLFHTSKNELVFGNQMIFGNLLETEESRTKFVKYLTEKRRRQISAKYLSNENFKKYIVTNGIVTTNAVPTDNKRLFSQPLLTYDNNFNISKPTIVTNNDKNVKTPTSDINTKKAGVEELFESNPELANAIYEVLGFGQENNIEAKKADIERRRQEKLNKINQKIEKLNKKEDRKIKVETYRTLDINDNPIEVEISTNADGSRLLRARQINEDGSVEPMASVTERINNKAQASLTNEKLIEGYIGNEGNTLKRTNIDENPDQTYINKINAKYDAELEALEAQITTQQEQITPEQKQEAQQLYSQYLDTIFPDSKVKDIVYHYTNAPKFEKFIKDYIGSSVKRTNVNAADSELGIFFGKKGLEGVVNKEKLGTTEIPALINIKNPNTDIYDEADKYLYSSDRFIDEQEIDFDTDIEEDENGNVKVVYKEKDKPKGKDFERAWYNSYKQDLISQKKDGIVLDNIKIVFEPEQIHILGSKQDIEGFKNWVSSTPQSTNVDENPNQTHAVDNSVIEKFETQEEAEKVFTENYLPKVKIDKPKVTKEPEKLSEPELQDAFKNEREVIENPVITSQDDYEEESASDFTSIEILPSEKVVTPEEVNNVEESNNKEEEQLNEFEREAKKLADSQEGSIFDELGGLTKAIDPKTLKNNTPNYDTFKKEVVHIKNLLPTKIAIKLVDDYVKVLNNGKVAIGLFQDNMIYLSKKATEGTAYHEAFHAVYRTMLSSNEQRSLYKEASKSYVKYTEDEIKNLMITHQVQRQDAIEIFYEEQMADDFMDFMKEPDKFSYSKGIKGFFERLLDWINNVFLDNITRRKLFNDISTGKYKNKSVGLSRGVAYKTTNALYIMPKTGEGFDPQDIPDIVKQLSYIILTTKYPVVTATNSKEAQRLNKDLEIQAIKKELLNHYNRNKAAGNEELAHRTFRVHNNLTDFYYLTKKYISSLGLSEELESQGEDSDGNIIYKPSYELSGKDGATQKVKLMIALIPKYKVYQADNFKNRIPDLNTYLGLPKFENFNSVWNKLEKNLSGLVPITRNGKQISGFELMMEKLTEMSKYHSSLAFLKNQLSTASSFVKSEFNAAFSRYNGTYVDTLISGTAGNFVYKHANADVLNVTNNIAKTWSNNFVKNFGIEDNEGNIVYNQEALNTLSSIHNKLNISILNDIRNRKVSKETQSILDAELTLLGINLSEKGLDKFITDEKSKIEKTGNEDQDLLKVYNNIFLYLNKALVSNATYNSLIATKNFSAKSGKLTEENNHILDQTFFKEVLAEAEAEFVDVQGENTIPGPDGTTKWISQDHSLMSIMLAQVKLGDTSLLEKLSKLPFNKSSKWINDLLTKPEIREKVKLVNYNNYKVENKNDAGNKAKDLKEPDQINDNINKYLKGIYVGLAEADKSQQFYIEGFNTENSQVLFKDGQIDTSGNNATNILYKYFTDEVARMVVAYNQLYNKEENQRLKNEDKLIYYHYKKNPSDNDGNWKISYLFPNMDLQAMGIIKYSAVKGQENKIIAVNGIETLKPEQITEIQKYIKEKFIKAVQNDIKVLNTYKIIKYEKGNFNNITIDSKILSEKYQNNVVHAIGDYTLNSIIANVEFTKLFTQDPALFKNKGDIFEDYKKRIPLITASGKLQRIFKEGIYEVRESYQSAVIQNIETPSAYFTDPKNIKTISLATGLSEDEVKDIFLGEDWRTGKLSAYGSVNQTDAQAWITIDLYRERMLGFGKWSDKHEDAYNRIISGNDILEDNLLFAQPLKTVHSEIVELNGVATIQYNKQSEAVLLPNLVRDTKMQNVLDAMKDQKIDHIITLDGKKVGARGITKILNDNNEILSKDEIVFNPTTLSNKFLFLQQDLPTKGLKDTLVGSQMVKNVLSMLVLTDDYEGIKGFELYNEYHQTISKLSDLGIIELQNKIGYSVEEDRIKDKPKFNTEMAEAIKDVASDNIINGLTNNLNINTLFQFKNKFHNKLAAMITRSAVKQKQPGGSMIYTSNFGMENTQVKLSDKIVKDGIIWFKKPNEELNPARLVENNSLNSEENSIFVELKKDLEERELTNEQKELLGERLLKELEPNQENFGLLIKIHCK